MSWEKAPKAFDRKSKTKMEKLPEAVALFLGNIFNFIYSLIFNLAFFFA